VSYPPSPTQRTWNFWLAPALLAATVVIAVADLVLVAVSVTQFPHSVDLSDINKAPPLRIELPLFGLGFASVGALIASRLRGNSIGWLFVGLGLEGAVQAFGVEYGEMASHVPGGLPLSGVGTTLNGRIPVQLGVLA
jgi:hypothetical protein